jgi:hypothetical protein
MTDHPLAQLAPFTSELDRLCWLVEVLTARGAKGMNPKHESSDEDLVAAATSLVSNGLQNARGAVNLLKGDLVMAAGPVERALYEIWCEVRMLFEQGSRGARKMFLNSLLELVVRHVGPILRVVLLAADRLAKGGVTFRWPELRVSDQLIEQWSVHWRGRRSNRFRCRPVS